MRPFGLIVAAVATWIAYLALVVARHAQQAAQQERERDDAHEHIKWIETLLKSNFAGCRTLKTAPHAEEFRDVQVAMRAALAIGGLRRQLPVTTILSERPFSEAAANGEPGLGAVYDDCRGGS